MRRYLAAGIWLAMTVTATLIVWAAVSVVAADVTDRPAPVVAHRDVVVALQGGSSGHSTTTTTTVGPRSAPPAPASVTRPTVTSGGRSGPPAGVAVAPAPTTTALSPPTTKPPARPGPPPTTTPPTTVAPTGASATYSTDGGSVAVACASATSIQLVAALPADGFQAVVTTGGPFFVQVNFVGQGRNIPVSAVCFFALPFQLNKGGIGG
ncbi:MAG: hypothetical protein M3083_18780 [Actinomycetota bacterium]|nr:hypothetical protein [Actinomycetota bacterium]